MNELKIKEKERKWTENKFQKKKNHNQLPFNKKIRKGLKIPGISLKLAKHLGFFEILENFQQNFI